MKNTLRIDFANNNIIMDRTFAKNCQNPKSSEYALLQRVRQDYSEFTVIQKAIKKKADKESYKGLTYAYMEKYIELHDQDGTIMQEYKEQRLISECHSVRFPVIKQWFLDKFPEIKKFGVPKLEDDAAEEAEAAPAAPAITAEKIAAAVHHPKKAA